ncbi:MAG: sulfatase-like hydrolase/transferase [Candidatus Eisenbacteria sp.]|nr:sulfatase-like hydrolase/transferase [Candidatus Eisenbacteria bacterium]
MKSILAVIVAFVLVLTLAFWAGWFESSRPNIILISVDTLRPDHLGCCGYDRPTSPTIDALVSRGVLFAQAVCQMPMTAPSFCSIMTGTYPHTHGSRMNGMPLREGIVSLAELLSEQGYRCAAFVSSYTVSDESSGLGLGFDTFDDDFRDKERSAEGTNARIAAYLNDLPSGPHFLWVHYFEPHRPYEFHTGSTLGDERPPPEGPLNTMDDAIVAVGRAFDLSLGLHHYVRLYDGEIAHADDQIGVLLTDLAARGLLENSLIVFVSDHGESFDHAFYCRHGLFLYESSVRIALAFVFPENQDSGRRIDALVQSVDVMPTVCDWLGVRLPQGGEGRSLMPLIRGEDVRPEPAFLERRLYQKPNMAGVDGKQHAIRTEEWKYILDTEKGEELYRLTEDRGELLNLAESEPERAAELRKKLKEWIAEARTDCDEAPDLDEEAREKLKALGYIQ